MSKKIKISVSSIVLVLSLMFGFVAYAKDGIEIEEDASVVACTMDAKLCSDGTSVGRTGPDCEFVCPDDEKDDSDLKEDDDDDSKGEEIKNKFKEIRGDLKGNREDIKIKRDEFKGEVKTLKDELENEKEVYKNQLEQMVELVKIKREEFKAKIELNREQAKQKIEETKVTFKENLNKIKDENKKISAEKIVDIILGLNLKITESLSVKTDQIENVLVSIESRTTKAEAKGLDVTAIKLKIEAAKTVIASTREAIDIQSKKTYEIGTITDEVTLKIAMKNLRDSFTKDIKALREQVKKAHIAVKEATTVLIQIPKVDEVESSVEVENETKTEDKTIKVESSTTVNTTVNN
ncbi:MAG: hypothetical protein WCT42_01085 [Candidatus Paceibacterota bacterium]